MRSRPFEVYTSQRRRNAITVTFKCEMYFGVRAVTTIEFDVAETLFLDHSPKNIKDVVESTGRYTMIILSKYVYSNWTQRAWQISMLSRQTWNISPMCAYLLEDKHNNARQYRNEIWDYGLCDKKKKVIKLFRWKPVLHCIAKGMIWKSTFTHMFKKKN